MIWTDYDLSTVDLTGLERHYNGSLDFLDSQIVQGISGLRSLRYHNHTPEQPNIPPRHSTEISADRLSDRLVISIGESFTWIENFYGMNHHAVSPVIQALFTVQGRIAAHWSADLRTVAVPGNANALMITALDRVLGEIQDRTRWREILILQQFTERARCDNCVIHPHLRDLRTLDWYRDWLNQWDRSSHHLQRFSHSYYQQQEILQLDRLSEILESHSDLPLTCVAWRNFDPWIQPDLTLWPRILFPQLSMNEFKYRLHGISPPEHPTVYCGHSLSNTLDLTGFSSDHIDWISHQMDLTEQQQDWLNNNRFHRHPDPSMSVLWSRYLQSQGARFHD